MSPIFIRPVREQLEHDRLIRQLLTRYKKKFDVAANIGDEQAAPVKIGANTFFPDLVISSGKKLAGLVEVETGESVNNLEAMAQWVHFSKARVPFHLYVPVQVFDAARRLCAANNARVAEIWTYRPAMEGFDLVRGFHDSSVPPMVEAKAAPPVKTPPPKPVPKAARPAPAPKPPAKPAVKPAPKPAAKKPAPKKKAGARPAAKANGKKKASKPAQKSKKR